MRDEAPARYREIQAKVLAGSASRALAIKVNCLQCVDWKNADVKECGVKECPLWHVRPYQAKVSGKNPAKKGNPGNFKRQAIA